jgi:hypothetical protein
MQVPGSSFGINPCAINRVNAIGKSKDDPLFGSQAGDNETVTFLFGHTSLLVLFELRKISNN